MSDSNANSLNVQRFFARMARAITASGWQGDEGLWTLFMRGRRVTIPPGEGIEIISQVKLNEVRNVRVTVGATLPFNATLPVGQAGHSLAWRVEPSVENDQIINRRITTLINQGQSMFVSARGLNVFVTNSASISLDAHISVEEQATTAPTVWPHRESFVVSNAIGVQPLNIPAFTQKIGILQATGAAGVSLQGVDGANVVVYQENFVGPRFQDILLAPNLNYIISGLGAAQTVTVVYQCQG